MIFDSLEQAIDAAYKYTLPDKICLLSPAAPSYDQFKTSKIAEINLKHL